MCGEVVAGVASHVESMTDYWTAASQMRLNHRELLKCEVHDPPQMLWQSALFCLN